MSAVPTRIELLAEFDGLPYDARAARMTRLALAAGDPPAVRRLVGELLSGDAYEANLGLDAAAAVRNEDALLRAIGHESVFVRRKAARLVARLVRNAEAIRGAMQVAAPEIRQRLLRQLARWKRTDIASELVPFVLERWGSRDASLLLAGASDAVVRSVLPQVAHACPSLRRIAKNHPDALLDWLRDDLAAAPQRERGALWARMRPCLFDLSQARPGRVLSLARELGPNDGLPGGLDTILGRLIRYAPAQTFELLTARPVDRARLLRQGIPKPVLANLSALAPANLQALVTLLAEQPSHLASLLRRIPPSRRADAFATAYSAEQTVGRQWPPELLEALPHALRDHEAARMLSLRDVKDDPARRLEVTSYRAPIVALDELRPATRASLAEDRAKAFTLLLGCLRMYRRPLEEALELVAQIKNDQDPVRMAALAALSRFPANRFATRHYPAMTALTDEVVAARDTSAATRAQLQGVAFGLLRTHAGKPVSAEFRLGLAMLEKLTAQTGMLALPPLEKHLPKGAEERIVEALLPRIRAAAERERHDMVLALTRALGRRAWNVQPLQDLLEQATRARPDWTAQQAMSLWLMPPHTRDARVRKLLDEDLSTIVVPLVLQHVTHDRQDWLDPFLTAAPIRGRFLTGNTVYVLPVTRGFYRWLPRQQVAFQRLLERVVHDAGHAIRQRAQAVASLGRLPTSTCEVLEPLARSVEVPIAEAALAALAWLDRPGAPLPLLFEFVEGDRARVAMYAVPRCARMLPTATLVEQLRSLLAQGARKVTTRKEVIRLLGSFVSDDGVKLLADTLAAPGLHRDLRIASGHAARRLIDVRRVAELGWGILERLADDDDLFVARSLLDARPLELAVGARSRYARLLVRVASHKAPRVRQEAFNALGGWSRGAEDDVASAAASRILDLGSGVEWHAAVAALVACSRDGAALATLTRVVTELATMPCPPGMDATRERDQPARQRLGNVVQHLATLAGWNRLALREPLSGITRALARDPSHWWLAAWLRIACTPWSDCDVAATRLTALALEAQHEPILLEQAATSATSVLADPTTEWDPSAVLMIVDALLNAGGMAPARIAVPLVQAASFRLSHPEACSARIRKLRSHPTLAVRLAAHAVFTAQE